MSDIISVVVCAEQTDIKVNIKNKIISFLRSFEIMALPPTGSRHHKQT